MNRPSGFYWIRASWKIGIGNESWQPAHWNGLYWYLIWSTDHFVDSDLLEIGESCERGPMNKPPEEPIIWWPEPNSEGDYNWPDGSRVFSNSDNDWFADYRSGHAWVTQSLGTKEAAAKRLYDMHCGPYHHNPEPIEPKPAIWWPEGLSDGVRYIWPDGSTVWQSGGGKCSAQYDTDVWLGFETKEQAARWLYKQQRGPFHPRPEQPAPAEEWFAPSTLPEPNQAIECEMPDGSKLTGVFCDFGESPLWVGSDNRMRRLEQRWRKVGVEGEDADDE